jgi:PTS system galactitol-specific IIA component
VFAPDLSVVRLEARSADVVIGALASRLLAAGHVKPTFERAAMLREKKSPTGLPFSPWAVALPHADPEHASTPAIALATLQSPVVFRQMGSPATKLEVSIVVMPAFTAKEQAAASLTRLITLLQSEDMRERIVAAASPDDLLRALRDRWDTP